MSDISKIVGNRIRQLRKSHKWSQEELAFRAGMNPAYVGILERAEKATTIESLEKLVIALGITFEEFFHFEESSYSNNDSILTSYVINKISAVSTQEKEIIKTLIDTLFVWEKVIKENTSLEKDNNTEKST
jgi:transcriptional regulator with XRE-family HTH domain